MAETSHITKHFPVSWEELHRHAKALSWRLAEMGDIAGQLDISECPKVGRRASRPAAE